MVVQRARIIASRAFSQSGFEPAALRRRSLSSRVIARPMLRDPRSGFTSSASAAHRLARFSIRRITPTSMLRIAGPTPAPALHWRNLRMSSASILRSRLPRKCSRGFTSNCRSFFWLASESSGFSSVKYCSAASSNRSPAKVMLVAFNCPLAAVSMSFFSSRRASRQSEV